MKIQIQSVGFKADEAHTKSVTEKLSKLEKFYDRIEKCDVTLKVENDDRNKNYVVEVRLAVPKEDVFSTERAESFSRALILISADLKKMLIRHKNKMKEPRKFREKASRK